MRREARVGGAGTGVALCVLVFFFSGSGPAPANAQVFRVGTWSGELQTGIDYRREESKDSGVPTFTSESARAEEALTLRNTGAFLWDRRIASFDLEGTFRLFQEHFDTTGAGSDVRQGTVWGYDLSADILSAFPYSLRLFAVRNQSVVPSALAGQSELDTETRGVSLFAKRFYFPSVLTFRQDLRSQEFRTGVGLQRQEEDRKTFTWQARRGWLDAEMDFRYELIDSSADPGQDFQSHEGALGYSMDFGPELNWRWDSGLRAFHRSGSGTAQATNAALSEVLSIDHTDRFRTQYGYLLNYTDSSGADTLSNSLLFSLHHRFYENLTTGLHANARVASFPGGTDGGGGSSLSLAYGKRLPGGGRLSADLGGGFAYDSRTSDEGEGRANQETHTVTTPFASRIALRNPFVVESSIVVTKVRLGPLPLGCLAPPGPPTSLVLGRDYALRAVGDITEIIPLPCTGVRPGLNPGDTIAVDYGFRAPVSLALGTTTWGAGVAVDYGWVSVFGRHSQSDQTLLSGDADGFLEDRQEDTVGATLRYSWPAVTASVSAEARRVDSNRFGASFEELRGSERASLRPWRMLQVELSAEQAVTNFEEQDRQSRRLAALASLSYRILANLFATASGRIEWQDDSTLPTVRTIDAQLGFTWSYRSLEVRSSVQHLETERGEARFRTFAVSLQVVRRF